MSNLSFNHFNYPPSTLILRQLIQPASLLDNIQTINKAIRFYFYLKNLYSQSPEFTKDCFSKQDLRDFLFKEGGHEKRDTVPDHSHSNCLCNKSGQEILFPSSNSEENWHQWQEEFITLYAPLKGQEELKTYLNTLNNQKPFKVTVKKIYQDLDELTQKGWLKKRENISPYQKCSELPKLETELSLGSLSSHPIPNDLENIYPFLPDDLASFTNSFSQPIKGIQRLFIHADYQIPRQIAQKITNLQEQLRKIWGMNPIPPLKILYTSASLDNQIKECLIYPACIYYHQRGFYLCGYGETPRNELNWYNYRLERIQEIKILEWTDSYAFLQSEINQKCGYYPLDNEFDEEFLDENQESESELRDENELEDGLIIEIQDKLELAYGFDFYQPFKTMLLRFTGSFHDSYIHNTLRHNTFKKISCEEAICYVKKANLDGQAQQQLLQKIKNNQDDSYYTLNYRQHDNSVIMRLRSWSPNVEVLLPLDLRQRMREDSQKTWLFYQDFI